MRREGEFARSAAEKDATIGAMRSKLDAARAEAKNLSRSVPIEEYKAQAETAEGLAKALERELNRLQNSPLANELREQLKKHVEGAYQDDETRTRAILESEIAAMKKQVEGSESETEALILELEDISKVLKVAQESNKRLLADIEQKESQARHWSTKVLEMNEQVNKMRNQVKLTTQKYESERQLRDASDAQYRTLKRECEVNLELASSSKQAAEEAQARLAVVVEENESLRSERSRFEADKQTLEAKIAELEKSNVRFRKEREDAVMAQKRAEEKGKKTKRQLERMSSMTAVESGNVREQVMENALRCPLRSEYWKDSIIIKCCHMFSRKALEDNLAKRNRKCPECKHFYSRDDIKEIYLYQKNDYDE